MGTAPVTPDRRYLVVRGRLWHKTNPGLMKNTPYADWIANLT